MDINANVNWKYFAAEVLPSAPSLLGQEPVLGLRCGLGVCRHSGHLDFFDHTTVDVPGPLLLLGLEVLQFEIIPSLDSGTHIYM